ncbi:MAG: hypothetical protein MUD00_00900 [Candidatus Pacebacteria bacterium]|jgi:hypothetical protein|nr:hypothetical protein [Candidatus Paceibacterota bacterium]
METYDTNSTYYYTRLHDTALANMHALGGSFVMVSGVLGVDTDEFEHNLSVMKNMIAELEADGHQVFDQTPYLDIYHDNAPREYAAKFEIFYKGVIQSGLITKLYVLPGFEHSLGVRSEIQYAEDKEIEVEYVQYML